jgi:hypothetical protein
MRTEKSLHDRGELSIVSGIVDVLLRVANSQQAEYHPTRAACR